MATKFPFKLLPRHIKLKIALQPPSETVLFAKPFRNCWPEDVCEKFANYPEFCNPLHVAVQSSAKFLSMVWSGENNYVCPPICLIPRVLLHMSNCKAQGTLIIPLWYSAPFWPLICGEYNVFREFVLDCMDFYRLI